MKKLLSVFGILLALLVVVTFVLWLFFFRIALVQGDDMAPGLAPGAWLLVDLRAEPHRGDLLVFRADDGNYQVRRVVALPGETVHFVKEVPVVDQTSATHELVREYKDKGRVMQVLRETLFSATYEIVNDTYRRTVVSKTYQVPQGYYVLADNREYARDSRQYGAVAKDSISGVAVRVLRPGEDRRAHV